MLTREQIDSAIDLKTKIIDVPEWGGQVQIKELSALERTNFREILLADDEKRQKGEDAPPFYCRLLLLTLCGADLQPLYSEGDWKKLWSKSAEVLERLWNASEELSALTPKKVDAEGSVVEPSAADKAIEEAEKNSESTQIDILPSS